MNEMMENLSSFNVLFLSGLQDLGVYKPFYFMLAFILYILIIAVNLTLIFIVTVDRSLHEPMYIFICNLCANELYGTAGFYPKFLMDLQSDFHTITYSWCITQMYVIYTFAMCEVNILTAMAYDRYVAICRPLQYHSIMTPHAVLKLLGFAWTYPLLTWIVNSFLTIQIPICRSHINKLFCDKPSVIGLGCYQDIANKAFGMTLIATTILYFVFILISYGQILHVCISSKESRTKVAKTCVPHILVMVMFSTTVLFDLFYSWDGSKNLSVGVRNVLSVQFLILPPLLNPIIYGLQLPQIRKVLYRPGWKQNIMRYLRSNG